MDISVSKNKHLIELNNGELVDINELVAKLSKMQNLEADLYEANHRINDLLDMLKDKEKEIEYWKEQAEGYSGLAEQLKEDFENRDRWE
ncbi:MAG TPA: hypothetical protein DEP51_04075 [Clostridiales bacterium]|nr:hypothetical protein [Clostridiales bacterium]